MPQIADVYERGISLNVMSKAYGLPGLRIGWLAMQDKEMLERFERYKHYLSICRSFFRGVGHDRAEGSGPNFGSKPRTAAAKRRGVRSPHWRCIPACLNGPDLWAAVWPFLIIVGRTGVEAFCQKLLKESGVCCCRDQSTPQN